MHAKVKDRKNAAPSPKREMKANAAIRAANGYLVPNYPLGFLGGTPRRLTLEKRTIWIVPIVLTSPGYGAVGEVGVIAVHPHTGKVLGGTPRAEVVAAAKQLREAKRDELQAAFLRARTV